MLRGGKSCQKCLSSPFWGSFYKCANGSLFRSFVQSLGQIFNYNLKRLEASGARIVAVSTFTQKEITKFSNLKNVGVLSNFISLTEMSPLDGHNSNSIHRKKFIWAGRVSHEKGLTELLEIWPSNYDLDVYGSGPDLPNLSKLHSTKSNICFNGAISNTELKSVLPRYLGFVNSSTWSEFAPMTVIEALSAGLPIIFPKGLSLGELISKYKAGIGFSLGDSNSLRDSLNGISDPSQSQKYKEGVNSLFNEEFSFEGWYKNLIALYTTLE